MITWWSSICLLVFLSLFSFLLHFENDFVIITTIAIIVIEMMAGNCVHTEGKLQRARPTCFPGCHQRIHFCKVFKSSSFSISVAIIITGFIFLIIIFMSSLCFFIEIEEDSGFTSIPTAFYWVVITMTTVFVTINCIIDITNRWGENQNNSTGSGSLLSGG